MFLFDCILYFMIIFWYRKRKLHSSETWARANSFPFLGISWINYSFINRLWAPWCSFVIHLYGTSLRRFCRLSLLCVAICFCICLRPAKPKMSVVRHRVWLTGLRQRRTRTTKRSLPPHCRSHKTKWWSWGGWSSGWSSRLLSGRHRTKKTKKPRKPLHCVRPG